MQTNVLNLRRTHSRVSQYETELQALLRRVYGREGELEQTEDRLVAAVEKLHEATLACDEIDRSERQRCPIKLNKTTILEFLRYRDVFCDVPGGNVPRLINVI